MAALPPGPAPSPELLLNEAQRQTLTCHNEAERVAHFYDDIPLVVKELVGSWARRENYRQPSPIPLPSHEMVVAIIHQARSILFPGYFTQTTLNPTNLEYYLGQQTTELYENLSRQIVLAIKHDCFRANQQCSTCKLEGRRIAAQFIQALPKIEALLGTDLQAALEGDPAAHSTDEVIFSYPGILAIAIYRMAHELFRLKVPIIPRIMTEHAHSLTGIDIHPGARIGESFFIDHGTGIVIGETTEIGNGVRLYQGVTLGALSLPKDAGPRFRNTKRHPTIEDEVIVYANTTIRGGQTRIGARSIIGGNIWLTESVPPDTKVLMERPKLTYCEHNE